MIKFKTLANCQIPKLDREVLEKIISYLKSIDRPLKTPIKDCETITVEGVMLRCFVFDRTTNDKISLDTEIVNLFKRGYTILTVWGEYDPSIPSVVFTWHPKISDSIDNDLTPVAHQNEN